MEKMANKYKEMVLGEFVSMGGSDSWHYPGTEMNIRCLIVTYWKWCQSQKVLLIFLETEHNWLLLSPVVAFIGYVCFFKLRITEAKKKLLKLALTSWIFNSEPTIDCDEAVLSGMGSNLRLLEKLNNSFLFMHTVIQ